MRGGEEKMLQGEECGPARPGRGPWRRGHPLAGPAALVCLAAALVLPAAGCDNDNDPTAPEDSTIDVSANPSTVVVTESGPGSSRITATIRLNGTKLPGQEVTFRTSAGTLDPPAQTPLTTDDQGRAECILTTSQTATITARSGSIEGTAQVQTSSGDISSILLTASPNEIFACSDTITLTARVLTAGGEGVSGVTVRFFNPDPPATIGGSFSPSVVVSDVNGESVSTWRPNSVDCPVECSESQGGSGCTFAFQAEDGTGDITSNVEQVDDNIP